MLIKQKLFFKGLCIFRITNFQLKVFFNLVYIKKISNSYSWHRRYEVSSVHVGPNHKMVFLTESDYKGNSIKIVGQNNCFRRGFNDNVIRHVLLGKNWAMFFKDCN